jgi:hypothetical protein
MNTSEVQVNGWRSEDMARLMLESAGRARVVFLTVRDPDFENNHVMDIIGDVEVRELDIDLGRSFNGPKHFWPELGEAEGREWLDSHREEIADLPADSNVRRAVEELCDDLEGRR